MIFTENKAIYQQIAARIHEEILGGVYQVDDRIPSVREYAGIVEVNANTVMRTYDLLQSQGVIYNKRGIGFFVSPHAVGIIRKMRRENFREVEAGYFFGLLESLEISPDELYKMYQNYLYQKTQKL